MIALIKKTAFRYGYLFIAAAWLYTFSFIFTNYFSYNASPKKVSSSLQEYIINQEKVFDRIINDTNALKELFKEGPSAEKTNLLNDISGLFVYQINDIGNPVQVYWNTSKMALDERDLEKPDGSFAVSYDNGTFEFIKHTIHYKNFEYYICNLIPIRWQYFMKNEYLKSEFGGYPEFSNSYVISEDKNGTPVMNGEGKTLFRIKEKFTISHDNPGTLSIIMRIIALIILMIFVKKIASTIVTERGFAKGFVFLILVTLLLRLISYYFPFPFYFKSLELFKPIIYASSNLHPSLGDLLVNVILTFWLIIFARQHYQDNFPFKNYSTQIKRLLTVICLFALPMITFECANLISSLVKDSTISLDAINFFSLNFYTFISFLIIGLMAYSYFYLSGSLIIFSSEAGLSLYRQIIILITCALVIITINPFDIPAHINIIIGIWLIAYFLLKRNYSNAETSALTGSRYFIFWAVFLMASAAAVIILENNKKEAASRIRIADKLDQQTDTAGETLLSLAFNFQEDFLRDNFQRFYSANENKILKDSLINFNFSGYLNKYDTRVYAFDSIHKPLFNEDSTTFSVITAIIQNQGKATKVPGLYFYENAADRFSYIYEKQLASPYGSNNGSLFIVAKPKVFKSEALVPELFKQPNDPFSDLNNNYSYAIYNKHHLIRNLNNYNFSDTINTAQVPSYSYYFKDTSGYSELWFKASNNKVIIVTRKKHSLIDFITLFAYLFLLFIFTAYSLRSAELLYNTGFQKEKIKKLFQLNIRSQIQATIIAISILSFLIIGAASISFFIPRFNKNSRSMLINIAQIMVNEIETDIKSQLVFNNIISLNNIGLNGDVDRKIIEIADIHNTDVNLYSTSGNLIVSTQSNIYDRKILSSKMAPDAFFALHYQRKIQLIKKELIGDFKYMSLYVPIRDEKGAPIAYLNIPYLNSQKELNLEISNFLVTLINLNALIFILAGSIAILLTTRITSSFQLISNKMKEVGLGKNNDAIEWKSNDEIGTLVAEYNKMVAKLGQSAEALAKSEREGAWREMARQVAHEIKNPLTPMKLSIQYLQKAIQDNAPNTKQLAGQVSQTLIEQIDQLAKIAGDFSQFANIEQIYPEQFDILDAATAIVNLYQTDATLAISVSSQPGNYIIKADKIQMNRLLTNLIKNAIEASAGKERLPIDVSLYTEKNNIIISIQDKGMGIDADMHSKIFQPNFTTKTSGTGLGLAICKAIVEKANGSIWFTTTPDAGSIFYVSLPQALPS